MICYGTHSTVSITAGRRTRQKGPDTPTTNKNSPLRLVDFDYAEININTVLVKKGRFIASQTRTQPAPGIRNDMVIQEEDGMSPYR
jgi:hypothetical protein